MTTDRRKLLLGIGAQIVGGTAAWAGDEASQRLSLEKLIRALMSDRKVPGLGFGLVRSGQVAWVESFGYADQNAQQPVTPDTVFHLASVSKLVTGTALMQLWEVGKFRLDDPIARYLDFSVVNPRHPQPITFRHLLMHTSSISDDNYQRYYQDFAGPGDPRVGLRDFLTRYLTPGGTWFTPEGTYVNAAPGQRFSYSNVGGALAGYLAERIGASRLQDQTRERIFEPLGMTPAAWSLVELGASLQATPYEESNGSLVATQPIGYPDWPAGLLRASTRATARFIAAYANGGRLGEKRILREPTVRAMMTTRSLPSLPNKTTLEQGLLWERLVSRPARLIGKFGGDVGTHTLVAIEPVSRNGAVILTNRSPSDDLGADMVTLAQAAVS